MLDLFRRKKVDKISAPSGPKPEVKYTGEGFRIVEGLDYVKVVPKGSFKLQHDKAKR
jgi:hypothetical protein